MLYLRHYPLRLPFSPIQSFSPLKGIVSVVLALFLAACGSLPEHTDRVASYTLLDNAETQLAQDLKPLLEANEGLSGFYTLGEGEGAFVARLRMIKAAQKSVDTQYYIWHDDLTGKAIHNRLLHAADKGVRVRLLLDDLDTAGKEATLHLLDSHPGIEIRVFNPFANRNARGLDFVTDLSRVNHRMHNKTLTADNQATILGGRNIGDEYFEATEGVAFGDLDIIGVGPVVNEVSAQFDLYWNSQWAYPLSAFREGEAVTKAELDDFRQESDAFLETTRGSPYIEALKKTNISKLKHIGEMEYSWGKWMLVYDDPSKVIAKEIKEETHLAPSLFKAFERTQKDLIVISPYFVPGDTLTAYFAEMVARGVRVRILTNALSANDVKIVHAGYMRYREDLIASGVELYEFKPTIEPKTAKQKKSSWTGSSSASLHAKSFVFDERYLFVGSFNLDARSVALNTEMGVYFESPKFAEPIARDFDENAIVKAFKVELDDDDLVWVTRENGKELRFEKEPNTSWWTRFSTGFLSIIVIESQL